MGCIYSFRWQMGETAMWKTCLISVLIVSRKSFNSFKLVEPSFRMFHFTVGSLCELTITNHQSWGNSLPRSEVIHLDGSFFCHNTWAYYYFFGEIWIFISVNISSLYICLLCEFMTLQPCSYRWSLVCWDCWLLTSLLTISVRGQEEGLVN